MGTRFRVAATTAIVVILSVATSLPASAAVGSHRLERLAVEQTKQLFRFYRGQPQVASPSNCAQAADRGVLLLPTLSFGSGDAAFSCLTRTHRVLLDQGGFAVTEDARGDTYTLTDGEVLTFTRANLPRICADVVNILPAPAPTTLDGRPVAGATVVTRLFTVHVQPGADNTPGQPYYQDSIDLGHPGVLAACYVGRKALIDVPDGVHNLTVDLSSITGVPTTFTYTLRVGRRCRS